MPTFANTINGNEILAKRSQCDYAGNDIQQTYATKSEVTTGLASKQDTISDLATIRSGAALGATSVQPGDLATVATTGAYSDLTGTPTIVDNGKIYGMDGTESYSDIYTKMAVNGIGITWVLNRVSPYVGKATYTACEITSDDTSNTSGYLRLTCVMRPSTASQQVTVFIAEAWGNASGFSAPIYSRSSTPIGLENQVYSWDSNGIAVARSVNEVPSYTTSEDGKVLGVVDNSGTASIGWVTPGGGGGDDAVLTYNVSTWSDFTTAYNAGKNIRVVETINGATYEAVLFEYNPNGSPYGYAKFTATSTKIDSGAVTYRWYQISNTGSGVWTHGAGTLQGTLSGEDAIVVTPSTRKISLTLDGSSLTQSSSGLAVANPLPSTIGTAGQVLQVNSDATGVEWATPSGGGSVTDVEVDGVSVVSQGVASITMPTVDQTFDSTSSDAQSGVAIAGELANINQVPASTSADYGKVLTVDSSGIPGWVTGGGGSTGLFEAVYGQTSYSDIVQAISDKKIVYCRVSPSGTSRMAFLAYIGSTNVEFQYYRSVSSKSATNQGDEVYVYAVSNGNQWTTTTRNCYTRITAGTGMSQRYSSGVLTLSADDQLPAATSSDEGKVLTVDANGDPQWSTGGGGGGTQADWTEDDPTDPSYIENKPIPKTLVAGTGITITETANNLTVAATAASYTAGAGINISAQNVITNTGVAINKTTPELCGSFMGEPVYTKLYEFTGTVGTSDTTVNFTIDEVVATGSTVTRIWLDPSNSFIEYGSASVKLPLTYFLSSARHGSVFVVSQGAGTISFRGVDTSSVGLTFFLAVKYTDPTP